MGEIKKTLVALGFSEYAKGTFNYSAKLAKNFGAELIVANIINSRDVSAVASVSAMGYGVDADKYVKDIVDERRRVFKEILNDSIFANENPRLIFKVGHPLYDLLKIIVNEKVDMVIMGVKGRTDLESIFVGSVAEKIFRRCPVTVVSYRDEKTSKKLEERIDIT
jgi:nucleotide-binding universal stress UspA family protein